MFGELYTDRLFNFISLFVSFVTIYRKRCDKNGVYDHLDVLPGSEFYVRYHLYTKI